MMCHTHPIIDYQHSAIIVEYAIIAIQFLIVFSSVKNKTKGHWAAAFMVGIFTMCAFVGYVVDIMYIPLWLHIGIGFFHIGWTAYFICRNHAAILVRGISEHEREQQEERNKRRDLLRDQKRDAVRDEVRDKRRDARVNRERGIND